MAWTARFNAEMRAKRDRERGKAAQVSASRLTGRQQFLADSSLNVSDLNMPADADVAIDESLFDDIDDLDLEEDDEDETGE